MTTEPISFEQQYEALRDGRGVVELSGWSSVTLTGADRQAFLHNFCTTDITRLVPGESCEAFFTNVKGRIVGHGLVTCRDQELVVIGTPNQAPRLIEHLERYLIRDDVQLRDATGDRRHLLLSRDDGHDANVAISWNLIGSERAVLLELSSDEFASVLDTLREQGYVSAGPPAFTAARVEAGMPLWGVDFDEQNFPQEVGRDRQAISFTKGCYLGQETVARIDALGHVNQRLVGVRFLGGDLPDPGAELSHAGKKVGRVTSAALSPRLNAPLALAMVRREANAVGTRLDSPVGPCEVVSLPVGS
jgi:folate-binding protein YgfZ